MDAVKKGDATLLSNVLKRNDINELDFHFEISTPLTEAIWRKQKDTVKILLCAGAGVEYPDKFGRTPLMVCAKYGLTDIAGPLRHHGANVHTSMRKHYGFQALHFAARHGTCDTAALLLNHGAEIYDPAGPWKELENSPILQSIACNHPRLIELFLDLSAKCNHRIPLKLALSISIDHFSEKCAIIFLKQGVFIQKNETIIRMGFVIVSDVSAINASYFYLAADNGLVELMGLLAELNPLMLQEEWLVEESIPKTLRRRKSKFLYWLLEYRKEPSSLVKLCKSTICAHLGDYYISKVHELPLPKPLKSFLASIWSPYS